MATDATREYELTTPLGDDSLLLRKMWGVERLSAPYEWDLDLISTDGDIDPDKLLGKHLSVGLQLNGGDRRYFSGIVSEFSTGGWLHNYNCYRAIVRPWFWLLTRTADCKIFQQKSVPDIFESVVKEYKFTDYKLNLSGSYKPWEYCVQYRETDFNFLSRLLEQEGIYYYFEHEVDKHTLVLIDDLNNHKPLKNYEKVPYYAPGGPNTQRDRDSLEAWNWTKSVESGSFATTDFDFEKPKLSLRNASSISRPHTHSDYEIFDYPSEVPVLEAQQTEAIAKVRIQELQTTYLRARGHGSAAGLAPGHTFTLEKYPRPDLNIEYLVTQATYSLTGDVFESGQSTTTDDFAIAIEAIDKTRQFRPERRTPKPVVQGVQTAMVVGQSGDEIYTDKYARVKVQFHWDRYGEKDEHSSCWIRVSQLWAGKTWGGIHIPRVGHEVIVSFLEGDPDQPIITGRVYNGDAMPPYALPGNETQSGIKSRSSKGGSEADFNEFRFEDKKGSEQVYLHAQKNQDIVVENDETQSIGHDRTEKVGHDETITIGNNRTEKVGVDESITIGSNRTEKVGVNETITIGANRKIDVGANESASVASMRTHNVGINESINVGAAQEINVGAAQTISVGAAQAITVGADQTTAVGANQSNTIGADQSTTVGGGSTVSIAANLSESVGGNHEESVSKSYQLKAGEDAEIDIGKNLNLVAGDEIVIKTGDASITMKKDGTIEIKGKDIKIDASGKINGKAGGDMILKGSKVTVN